MKPFARLFETIIDLLKRSLKDKWYADSQYGILDDCPFCDHACQRKRESKAKINTCQLCLVPDSICGPMFEFSSSMVHKLENKFSGYCKICDIDTIDLLEMQALFHNEIEALERELT